MSDTKFTPGPWEKGRQGEVEECFTPIHAKTHGALAQVVTEMEDFNPSYPDHLSKKIEVLANAHLIAAAPELYEALETMLQFFYIPYSEGQKGAQDKARTALAKARGETQ